MATKTTPSALDRWRAKVADVVFGDLITAREATVREQTLAEEDRGWRALSAGTSRDVPYQSLVETLNDATEAWRANPLAFRITELTTDYVLGKGMRLRARAPAVQRWIDKWWNHPLNKMDLRQFDWSRELSLSGELFVTFHTNEYDGVSYVRTVPSVLINQIETDPEDIEHQVRFHELDQITITDGIVRGKTNGTTPGRWWDEEHLKHYAINLLVGTVRGQSDLAPLLPWLRRYKDWLTDRVRINKYRSAFLWDVKMTGAQQPDINRRQAQLANPPNPGTVIVHNESEEWTAVKPEIGADDVESDGRAMRLMIAAGAGLPLHFLSEGEGANKATAAEMGGPTLRHLERRQLHFGSVIVDVAQHALRLSGQFDGADISLTAEFEDLSTQDNERIANAANIITSALAQARDRGWVNDKTAARLVAKFAGEPTLSETPS